MTSQPPPHPQAGRVVYFAEAEPNEGTKKKQKQTELRTALRNTVASMVRRGKNLLLMNICFGEVASWVF